MAMALAASLLFVLLAAANTVYGTDHTVGGSSGWALSVDYATWAAGGTFKVGDNLVFNYDTSHKVDQVGESDYNSCSSSNALKSYQGGSTTIALSSAGTMYFICPTAGHCLGGMKLAVTVTAANSTSSGSPPATSTPTTTTASHPPPPPPSHSGAISGFGGISQLMASFFVSAIILAVVG